MADTMATTKAPPPLIIDFEGKIYAKGGPDYEKHRKQYASSSHQADHDMAPLMVAYPKNTEDIKRAIRQANQTGNKIAIRTGGHQYSGASSTGSANIQLDLSETFRSDEDFEVGESGNKTMVRASVSWKLSEFNNKLAAKGLFVPHGQCAFVRLGGHVQTGGFGQLGRSFGLFGDHVDTLSIIDSEANNVEVSRRLNPDLFYAFLGGSPGNLGVITHIYFEAHRDKDHTNSQGLRVVYPYMPSTLTNLMDILTQMSDDVNFPRNYDLCVSVLSQGSNLKAYEADIDEMLEAERPNIEKALRESVPELLDENGKMDNKLPGIVVYAQWISFNNEKPSSEVGKWFDSLLKAGVHTEPKRWTTEPVSFLTKQWIFDSDREFNYPYVKRAYSTTSRKLNKNGWVKYVVQQANKVVLHPFNGLRLVYQIQSFGGTNSRFAQNRDKGTAYSWRDTSMIAVMDCFYLDGKKSAAEAWQRENDKQTQSDGLFSSQDRRFLWGSYGKYDLHADWKFYYENSGKYERLQRTRKAADPRGTFTPNPFCVKRAA